MDVSTCWTGFPARRLSAELLSLKSILSRWRDPFGCRPRQRWAALVRFGCVASGVWLFCTTMLAASFTDAAAGLPGLSGGGGSWGDYDNDGHLDLLLSGVDPLAGYRLDLWRNDNGTFTRVDSGLPQGSEA